MKKDGEFDRGWKGRNMISEASRATMQLSVMIRLSAGILGLLILGIAYRWLRKGRSHQDTTKRVARMKGFYVIRAGAPILW
jgi:hypothetical protein